MTKETIIRHIVSLFITFIATFFLVMSFAIMDSNFVFSVVTFKALVVSALISGARAVAKIVYELCYKFLSSNK